MLCAKFSPKLDAVETKLGFLLPILKNKVDALEKRLRANSLMTHMRMWETQRTRWWTQHYLPSWGGDVASVLMWCNLSRISLMLGFSVICWFCRLRLSRFVLNLSIEIFPPHGWISPLSRFCLRAWIIDASYFPASLCLQQENLFFRILSAINAHPRNISCRHLAKLVQPWLVFCTNRMMFNHFTDRNNRPLPGGYALFRSEHLHSIPIATVQQTFFLLLCGPVFQQYHSSQIDEALMYKDSMISFHRICQIPMHCHGNNFRLVWRL